MLISLADVERNVNLVISASQPEGGSPSLPEADFPRQDGRAFAGNKEKEALLIEQHKVVHHVLLLDLSLPYIC